MKNFFIILYVALILLLCFAGTTETVIYAKEGFLRWFPFIIIFVAQPIALYFLLEQLSFASTKVASGLGLRGIIATSVLIISLAYVYYAQVKRENDLLLYADITNGVVYHKWYDTDKKSSKWLLKCRYIVDGKTFVTFSETDKENKYKIGDTLTILYSSRYPENCTIKELMEQ